MLVLTDKFAPHAGGTAVLWAEWCRCWRPQGLRVITREFPGWEEYDARQAYSVRRVPFLDIPKVRMPLFWLRLFLRTIQELREERPAVFHCGQILETGWYAPWLKRRFDIPYIVHTYGEELNAYARSPHLRERMRRVLAGASGVTAVSSYTSDLLRRRLDFHGPVTVVRPGVNTERFVPGGGSGIRERLGLGDGPLLVTIARLMRRKGHDRVLQALPELRRRFPDLRYVVGGTGPENERLRSLVAEAGLGECVTFLGRVRDEDLVPLMQAADIFVHPNRELENGDVEGFGIVFLEANACGTPVIGGSSGGAPDAIRHGETGFLVDPDSADDLIARIATLLENRSLRERMGQAGREWATRFTWSASAARVWDLSQQVAASR